jgi:hypothetical protein
MSNELAIGHDRTVGLLGQILHSGRSKTGLAGPLTVFALPAFVGRKQKNPAVPWVIARLTL